MFVVREDVKRSKTTLRDVLEKHILEIPENYVDLTERAPGLHSAHAEPYRNSSVCATGTGINTKACHICNSEATFLTFKSFFLVEETRSKMMGKKQL